jgi:hypothetical protein
VFDLGQSPAGAHEMVQDGKACFGRGGVAVRVEQAGLGNPAQR